MASLTHALIGNGSKRSSSYSRESRLRLVRRECKPLSVTVGASNRSASDRKPISRASHPSKRREKNSSLFSLHLSYKCFVTFRNSRAYFSRFLERLVVKRNETKRNSSRPLDSLSLLLSLSLVAFANSARKEPRDLLCGGSIENTCNFAAFRIAVSQSIRPLRLICPVTRLVGCAKFIIPATMEKLRRE